LVSYASSSFFFEHNLLQNPFFFLFYFFFFFSSSCVIYVNIPYAFGSCIAAAIGSLDNIFTFSIILSIGINTKFYASYANKNEPITRIKQMKNVLAIDNIEFTFIYSFVLYKIENCAVVLT
jgi:hypothetical protein